MADELMGVPVKKEVTVQRNPDMARAEKRETVASETISCVGTNPLSEPFLKDSRTPMDRDEGRSDKSGKRKPSVRAELNELKKERAEKIKNEAKHKDRTPVKNDKSKAR